MDDKSSELHVHSVADDHVTRQIALISGNSALRFWNRNPKISLKIGWFSPKKTWFDQETLKTWIHKLKY